MPCQPDRGWMAGMGALPARQDLPSGINGSGARADDDGRTGGRWRPWARWDWPSRCPAARGQLHRRAIGVRRAAGDKCGDSDCQPGRGAGAARPADERRNGPSGAPARPGVTDGTICIAAIVVSRRERRGRKSKARGLGRGCAGGGRSSARGDIGYYQAAHEGGTRPSHAMSTDRFHISRLTPSCAPLACVSAAAISPRVRFPE